VTDPLRSPLVRETLIETWRSRQRALYARMDRAVHREADALGRCADELEAEAALLASAPSLREWAQHKPECELNEWQSLKMLQCTCGLDAALVAPSSETET